MGIGIYKCSKVRSKTKVASYVMKYITKNLVTSPVGKGKKTLLGIKKFKYPRKNVSDEKS